MANNQTGIFGKLRSKFNFFFRPEEVKQLNPQFELFDKLDDTQEVATHSIIDKVYEDAQSKIAYDTINSYKRLVYGNISEDKAQRLYYFRSMAKFPEVADAIDEISDACINYDDNNKFVNLLFNNISNLNAIQKDAITEQFEKFISLFNFEENGFEYFRNFIVDAEVAWENIVDENNKEQGIIGLNHINPECFEYLVNHKYEIIGILFNAKILSTMPQDTASAQKNPDEIDSKKWGNLKFAYSSRNPGQQVIPMPIEQVTLVNSGVYSPDKRIVFPVLERARRAYNQLSLVEDAIIIYRLIRAPERFVFNVDTGKLPASKAEELVYKLMKRYQTKKIYDPQNGTIVNDYDVHQMLESFWFPKPEGSSGTDVSTISTGANLGELEDLSYFLRKLYLSLKVPYDRYQTATNQYEKGDTITYEEYRFAKFIIRIQTRFSKGIKEAFKNHLKLTGLWEQYNLNERAFRVVFNPPTAYDMYVQQRILNLKLENYDLYAGHEEFSKDNAARRFLGWTDKDIQENIEGLEREQIRKAYIARKLANIEDHGTPLEKGESEPGESTPGLGSFGSDMGGETPPEETPPEETPGETTPEIPAETPPEET